MTTVLLILHFDASTLLSINPEFVERIDFSILNF